MNDESNKYKKTVCTFIIAILIIIVLIFFIIFIKFKFFQNQNINDSNIEEICNKYDTIDNKREECFLINTKCKDDLCFLEKSLFFKNETICQNIINESIKNNCVKVITFNKAIENAIKDDNVNLCNVYNGTELEICQDNYYLQKVYKIKDKNLCNKITSEVLKNECLQI